MTRNYDVPSYGIKDRPAPEHGWTITRNGEGILALPPDTPELVVKAIVACLQSEADGDAQED